MIILQQIRSLLDGSILKVIYQGEENRKVKDLNIKEYEFQVDIPSDKYLVNLQYDFTDEIITAIEKIGNDNHLTLRRKGSQFIFFKIVRKQKGVDNG